VVSWFVGPVVFLFSFVLSWFVLLNAFSNWVDRKSSWLGPILMLAAQLSWLFAAELMPSVLRDAQPADPATDLCASLDCHGRDAALQAWEQILRLGAIADVVMLCLAMTLLWHPYKKAWLFKYYTTISLGLKAVWLMGPGFCLDLTQLLDLLPEQKQKWEVLDEKVGAPDIPESICTHKT
jgi:hypothetical protein